MTYKQLQMVDPLDQVINYHRSRCYKKFGSIYQQNFLVREICLLHRGDNNRWRLLNFSEENFNEF